MPSTTSMTKETKSPPLCEFCGAERETLTIKVGEKVMRISAVLKPCHCTEGQSNYAQKQAEAIAKREAEEKSQHDKELQRRVERITGESGMGARFLRRTFDTYKADTPDTKKIYAVCRKYAEHFNNHLPRHGEPLPGRNGFIITGDKGTGKTHIAAAIANYLLNKGISAMLMTERNLFGKIREAYSHGRRFGHDDLSESEIRGMYETVPLLVIDDLGKEKATEWTLATLYAIIDGRYDRAMPIIITTNYDTQNLIRRITPQDGDYDLNRITAEAIVDRLIEMSECISVTGKSWRGL